MTDGTKRSSVESSGAHDRHQESNRTAGALSRRNHDRRAIVARSSPIVASEEPFVDALRSKLDRLEI